MNEEEMRELERRSRGAFDESVEALDAATRSRLARARSRALEEYRQRRFGGPALWIPAGAAAAALAAAVVLQRDEAAPVPMTAEAAAGPFEDLDMMTVDDFDMLGEDEGFYAWAEEQVYGGVG